MLRVDVEFTVDGAKHEMTFRTNKTGSYLFTGVGVNNQISCESGFNSLKRIKKAIRSHIVYLFGDHGQSELSRIKYTYVSSDFKA